MGPWVQVTSIEPQGLDPDKGNMILVPISKKFSYTSQGHIFFSGASPCGWNICFRFQDKQTGTTINILVLIYKIKHYAGCGCYGFLSFSSNKTSNT